MKSINATSLRRKSGQWGTHRLLPVHLSKTRTTAAESVSFAGFLQRMQEGR